MTAITDIPTNKNFLSPLGFTFTIKKTPNINFFVQSASIPSIGLGQSDIQTPFNKLPIPGDKIDFGTLSVSFRVDEDMNNFQEIFDWMISIGFPENFAQYNNIAAARGKFGGALNSPMSGEGVYSDASLMVLNSVKAPIVEVAFKDLYPIQISEIVFDTKITDVDYVDCNVTFAYRSFTLNRL